MRALDRATHLGQFDANADVNVHGYQRTRAVNRGIRKLQKHSQCRSTVDCEQRAKCKLPRKHRTLRIDFRIMVPGKLPQALGRTLPRGGSGAVGFPRPPESLSKQAIGSSSNTLPGRARDRRLV